MIEANVDTGLRVPPQSISAEQSILGTFLLNNNSIDLMTVKLQESDFYSFRHQAIYKSILAIVGLRQEVADVISVSIFLDNLGKLEDVGGIGYLNSLAQTTASTSNLRRYAETIKEKSDRRKIIESANKMIEAAYYADEVSAARIIEIAESDLTLVSESLITKTQLHTMANLTTEFVDAIQWSLDNQEDHGVKTGYYALDEAILGGLLPGDLIVIAGRPSMGKTSLAMNIVEDVGMEQGLPVLVITLEMKASALYKRMAGSISRIDQRLLKKPKDLQDKDWSTLLKSTEKMGNSRIEVAEGTSTIASIRSIARTFQRKHKKIGLIVVDYLQLMGSDSPSNESRVNEVSNISRGLKLLAGEMDSPLIAISQLNRSLESRVDKRPMMSDIRESGAIEQDADVIMFTYRNDYYEKDVDKHTGVAEIIISKQRNGPTGTILLGWSGEHTRFNNR